MWHQFNISVCYRNKWNRIKLKPLTLEPSLAVEIRRNWWVLKPRSWYIYLRISVWRTQTGIGPTERHNKPFPSLLPRRICLNFYDQAIFPPYSKNCSRFFETLFGIKENDRQMLNDAFCVQRERRQVIRNCLDRFEINRAGDINLRSGLLFSNSYWCVIFLLPVSIYSWFCTELYINNLQTVQLRAGASVKVPEGLLCADLSESVCILHSPILQVLDLTHGHTQTHTHTHFLSLWLTRPPGGCKYQCTLSSSLPNQKWFGNSLSSFNSDTLSKTLNAFQRPPLFSLAYYQLVL